MNKTINIRGINRNNPITNNADGNCDEIYNLRPKGGMWQAVGRKKMNNQHFSNDAIWMQSLGGLNKSIVKYHQHKVGDSINHIFIIHAEYDGVGQTDHRIMGVWAKPTSSVVPYEPVLLWSINTDPENQGISALYASVNNSLGIDIESIGNFLTFNLPEVTTFLWDNGEYKRTEQTSVSCPSIQVSVHSQFIDLSQSILKFSDEECGKATLGGWSANNSYWPSQDEVYKDYAGFRSLNSIMFDNDNLLFNQSIVSHWFPVDKCNNKFNAVLDKKLTQVISAAYLSMQNLTTDYREGFVFVCSAYQLFDGTYTNFSTPVMYHLGTHGKIWGFSSYQSINDIDTFFNPDKFQITTWHMGSSYVSGVGNGPNSQVGFGLEGFVRRQNMQRLIIERPSSIPTLNNEYDKIVYFVSPPISMYDFSNIKAEHLHITFKCGTTNSSSILLRLDGNYADVVGTHEGYTPQNKKIRMSLGNQMNWVSDGASVGWATTPSDDAFKEAIEFHAPTIEELQNLTLYKAVEFSVRNSEDVGELYQTDNGEVYGKVVNFKNLVNGEAMKAETSSTTTYKAKGLLAYNRRLHMYGVQKIFRDDITYNDGSTFSSFNFLHYDDKIPEEYTLNNVGIGLYHKTYSDINDGNHLSMFSYVHHCVFLLKINGVEYKYVELLSQIAGPILMFPDSRVDSVYCYTEHNGTYYKFTVGISKSSVYNLSIASLFSPKNGMSRFLSKDFPLEEVTEEEYSQYDGHYGEWVGDTSVDAPKELMVSEQSNPLIFPPELDYIFDDDIVAIGTNYKEISLAQDGQYPLYVFTKKGIWTMGLGTYSFYSTQIPVHPDIAISRNTIGIGGGVVYVAKDGIKVINGREVTSLSEPLRGNPSSATYITSLLSALGHGQNPNRLNTIYTSYMNGIGGTVKEYQDYYLFNENITLGFDRMNNELMVCNSSGDIGYSNLTKVYNFNSGSWYTRTERFYSFFHDFGCRMMSYAPAINLSGNAGVTTLIVKSSLVDLTSENNSVQREQQSPVSVDTQAMFITRPMSLGNLGFKQVYHAALRGELKQNNRTTLGTKGQTAVDANNPHLGFYIIASNDGGNWKMVGGKCWKESVTQVVLERIKQSYRYVIFVFAGYVNEEFNITHIDLDGIDKLNNRQR